MAEQSYISSSCVGSPTTAYDYPQTTCVALNTANANDEYVNADSYQTRSSPCKSETIDLSGVVELASTLIIVIIVVSVVCGCFCIWLVICCFVGGPAALCVLVGISKRPYAPPGPNAGTIF